MRWCFEAEGGQGEGGSGLRGGWGQERRFLPHPNPQPGAESPILGFWTFISNLVGVDPNSSIGQAGA